MRADRAFRLGQAMNVTPFEPQEPRMARLADALRHSLVAIDEFRAALRHVNNSALQDAAAPVVETAQMILSQHQKRAERTIADDVANLRALFSHLPVPREDADLGPLPGLKTLRSARGNLREEFDAVLEAARSLGWRPSDPDLPDAAIAELPRQRFEGILRALVMRMEAVERLLDEKLQPEGEPSPERTAIQIALVQVFVKNMKMELSLAKLEAQVKSVVDLAALGRAIENVTELTADFIATVRGVAAKMTAALHAASEELRPRVKRVAGGFKTLVRRVASVFVREREQEERPEAAKREPEGHARRAARRFRHRQSPRDDPRWRCAAGGVATVDQRDARFQRYALARPHAARKPQRAASAYPP